jgi:hypothetical protein
MPLGVQPLGSGQQEPTSNALLGQKTSDHDADREHDEHEQGEFGGSWLKHAPAYAIICPRSSRRSIKEPDQ